MPNLPLGVVIRHTSNFIVDAATAYSRALDGDIVAGSLLIAVYAANVAHISIDSLMGGQLVLGLPFDGSLLRPVSVYSLANSLGVPSETVRRILLKQEELGRCHRTSGGVVIDPAALATREMNLLWDEIRARFMAMLQELSGFGLDFNRFASAAPTNAGRPPRVGQIDRALAEFQVRQIENFRPVFGDIPRGVIWTAVLGENLSHVLSDRAAAKRNAEAPLPDEERRPVTIRRISQRLMLPYETTRRQIHVLEEADAVAPVNGGYIVPQPVVLKPRLAAYKRTLLFSFGRLIADLQRIGFEFDSLAPVNRRGPVRPAT